MAGDFEEAVRSAEAGLEYAPGDPALLIIKGVGEENLGQAGKAAQDYAQAQAGLETPEEFFLLRGQAYLAANLLDLAERDAEEAVRLNPESAMAYLLAGQIHEVRREFAEAIQYYDTAFETASRNNQPQLEAIARTRTAMVMQMMNMQVTPPVWFETPTPVP